jgi:hypothetical protein
MYLMTLALYERLLLETTHDRYNNNITAAHTLDETLLGCSYCRVTDDVGICATNT